MSSIHEEENVNYYETNLTSEEYKYLQNNLPKGFSLIQPGKANRTKPPTRSINNTAPIYRDQDNSVLDGTSTRREHRPTRVVRNIDHEIVYTAQKLPKNVMDSLKKCKNILNALKKHRSATPFLRPVDPLSLNCPDYFEIIKEPMDLGTVEKKLRNNDYSSPYQFFANVRKIWSNAFTYNPRNSQVYNLTLDISQYFEELYKEIELPVSEDLSMLENKVQKLEKKLTELNNRKGTKQFDPQNPGGKYPPSKNENTSSLMPLSLGEKMSTKEQTDMPMSFQEKKSLTMMIKTLPTNHLKGVWQIICNDNPTLSAKKELVIDIERLPTKTARELEKYVRSKIHSNHKLTKKKIKKSGQIGFSAETADNLISSEKQQESENTAQTNGHINTLNDPFKTGEENDIENEIPQNNQDAMREEASSDSSFFTDLDSDEENK